MSGVARQHSSSTHCEVGQLYAQAGKWCSVWWLHGVAWNQLGAQLGLRTSASVKASLVRHTSDDQACSTIADPVSSCSAQTHTQVQLSSVSLVSTKQAGVERMEALITPRAEGNPGFDGL